MTFVLVAALACAQVQVRDDESLRNAVRAARAGARIAIAAGRYRGDLDVAGLRGEPGRPIVLAGADPKDPPVFEGGAVAMHLRGVAHVEIADLVIRGMSGNGINIDDDGRRETPSHHVTLRRLTITDVGGRGNHDGIKMSGVDDFLVEGCTIERWGGGGSAVDLVGCHRGVIERSTFRQEVGAGDGANGVQTKGGSRDVAIRRCRFENAGSRAINIGGSTGLDYFRPPLGTPPDDKSRAEARAEARAITVEGNTILGSDAPIAFVGVDGAIVRRNTIYLPRRWAIRMLQETTAPGFIACRRGEFTRNLVVFRSDQWSAGGVNVGPGTDAPSFEFAENWWYCTDDPARSRPTLPAKERDGVYGKDPCLRDPEKGDLRLRPDSPAKKYGAESFE